MIDPYREVMLLINGDLFGTDALYEWLFGFGESEHFDNLFLDAGFEGSNFIVGIGPIFLMVVIFVVWVPL